MTATSSNDRPGLAIIANCLTPYRIHLHQDIVARLPEVRLHTLISHGAAEFDWRMAAPSEINAQFFAEHGESPLTTLYDAPRREWRKGGKIIDYLHANNVRAVICSVPRYLSYLRVVIHGRRTGLPVFVRSDANIKNENALTPGKAIVKNRFYRWWIRRAFGIMSMGSYGDEYFLKYGADRNRLYRVPYWPDCDFFSQVDPQRLEQFCQKYGLRKERKYFVFSGRLAAVKRVDLLIDAFARIAAERPDWDLLIVGDGVLNESLRSRVPEPLRSRVVWTGFLDHNEPVLAYHAADVLVLPSDREPWAVVVQEAMAAGLVVVASDVVGAARELVRDGVNGRIFPAGDVDSLTTALRDASDPQRLEQYQGAAKEELRRWRHESDPIVEIRRALVDAGALKPEANAASHSLQP